MSTYLDKIKETVNYLRETGVTDPDAGVVLGTGLGKFVDHIDVEVTIDYTDIPHFPIATVEFHSGKLIFGRISGKKIIVMQGRFHYYEGYDMAMLTFPIRVLKALGIKQLLLSNACGAMNMQLKKGSLMLIDDHINLLPDNPLRGKNEDSLGPRFPDMSRPYSKELNDKLLDIAKTSSIPLHQGVYVAVSGPNLETRAEYRFLRMIGADVVGMSTVPEVIVANHMELPCCAVSVITDECDPDHLEKVNIEDIIAAAKNAEVYLIELYRKLIKLL